MSYLAFALKYRPQDFDGVVGQQHVVTSLKNAILKNRVHHAYLFSGPRGVGKTSLARIFAKSLNCEKGPTVKPCDKCPSCLDIAKANSLDVIEIDGASNNGVDEIRTLRENVKLTPAHSRFKIYIIDEVHMLSDSAFNALLKTLEEPPAHVKFVFATTHPHKVPPTIISRCQKFQFTLLPLERIVDKLKSIVKAEKLKVADNLIYAIARAGEGSIRDAESLLDQIIPVILEKGSVEDVLSFLGIIDEETLNTVTKAIVDKDLNAVLDIISNTAEQGKDLSVFLSSLISHLRNLLLAKVSTKGFSELIDISPQSKDLLLKLSKSITATEVLKVIDGLIRANELSKRLNTVRIPLELAIIKSCYNMEEEPTVKIKPNPKVNLKKPPKNNPVKQPSEDDDLDMDIDDFDLEDSKPEVKPQPKKEKEDSLDDVEPAVSDDVLLIAFKAKWKEIISLIQKKRAALASHLTFAAPFSSAGDVVSIAFSLKNKFHKEMADADKNIKYIEEVASELMNRKIGVRFVVDDAVDVAVDIPVEEKKEAPQPRSNDPEGDENEFINELLDTFKGKIHTDDE